MEQEPDKQHFFKEIKNLFVEYLQTKLELTRITVFEKIARVVALLFSMILLTILLFFSILFVSLVGGFYLSRLFNSTYYGFAVVAGFYVVLFIVLSIFRRSLIEKFIVNAVIRILFKEKNETK